MKKIGWKRGLAWILTAALASSICPDIGFEQREDGSVSVEVGAYAPEKVQADENEPVVTTFQDWDYEITTQYIQNINLIVLENYKGTQAEDATSIIIPSMMECPDPVNQGEMMSCPVILSSMALPSRDSKCDSLTSISIQEGVTINQGLIVNNVSLVTSDCGLFSPCSELETVKTIEGSSDNDNPVIVQIGEHNMESMFSGCSKLTTAFLADWEVSSIESMKNMFKDCTSLTYVDLNGWVPRVVTDMEENPPNTASMFQNCNKLDTIYADWELDQNSTSDHTNMFVGCSAIKGGKGTTYNSQKVGLEYARPDQGPSSLSPGYFTKISADAFSPSLVGWNIEADTFAKTVRLKGYDGAATELSIPATVTLGANTYKVVLETVGGNENIKEITLGDGLMIDCPDGYEVPGFGFLTGLEELESSRVIVSGSMENFFRECNALKKLDLSAWDTSLVTNMNSLFCADFYADSYLEEVNISGWNFSNLTDAVNMFCNCERLTTIYASENCDLYERAKNQGYDVPMFTYCESLVGGSGTSYKSIEEACRDTQDYEDMISSKYARIDDSSHGNPGYFTLKKPDPEPELPRPTPTPTPDPEPETETEEEEPITEDWEYILDEDTRIITLTAYKGSAS
ncbi:MAG: BspA family leucine-rich repeat surface protein, partial [Lachnospiraceae bacterium]|nr:BspA family leucine-rich repeat surface protein [Lachnospiraceae bacterium]